ncbi:MAG TPA: DUF2079 domain-containing protein [Candidatus Acidoferrales bacterium]|nr:DUF2079 domain-containing protein [Candidatus Acidoferrales bacterium]
MRRSGVALTALVCGWAAFLSWLGLWKFAIYRADVDDGIFTQVLLSFGHGFSSTVEGGVNHLSVHFSPILFLLVPLVRAVGDARALIVAQALLCALVAIPVYAIARRRVGAAPSVLIAAIALCYPPLWALAFTDFHEAAFVPVLAATLAWALDAGKRRAAFFSALALCCTKEDQFVIVGAIGIIAALVWRSDRGRVQLGLTLSALAAGMAVLYFLVLRPLFFPGVPYWSLHFYNWTFTGGSPLGYAPLASPIRVLYLFWAFAPLLFIPLRSRLALLAIPGFIEVLASHEAITISLGTHYVAAWMGYVLAAFAAGCAELVLARDRWRRAIVAAAPIACALTLFFNDPMARWYFLYRTPNEHDAALGSLLRSLPRDVTIGADDEIFAHLANRREASIGLANQRFLVFDADYDSERWKIGDPRVRALLQAGTYRKLYERDGAVVLARAR